MLTSKGWTWLIKYGFLKHYIHLVDDWLDDDMLTDLTACWLSSSVSMSETVPLHLYIYIYIKCKPLYIYIYIYTFYTIYHHFPRRNRHFWSVSRNPPLPSPDCRPRKAELLQGLWPKSLTWSSSSSSAMDPWLFIIFLAWVHEIFEPPTNRSCRNSQGYDN